MIRMWGASDDLVYIEGQCIFNGSVLEDGEELYADREDGITFYIGDKAIVRIEYCMGPGATWGAQIDMVDEGILIPWTVAISTGDDSRDDFPVYTVIVIIDCPEDTEVTSKKID